MSAAPPSQPKRPAAAAGGPALPKETVVVVASNTVAIDPGGDAGGRPLEFLVDDPTMEQVAEAYGAVVKGPGPHAATLVLVLPAPFIVGIGDDSPAATILEFFNGATVGEVFWSRELGVLLAADRYVRPPGWGNTVAPAAGVGTAELFHAGFRALAGHDKIYAKIIAQKAPELAAAARALNVDGGVDAELLMCAQVLYAFARDLFLRGCVPEAELRSLFEHVKAGYAGASARFFDRLLAQAADPQTGGQADIIALTEVTDPFRDEFHKRLAGFLRADAPPDDALVFASVFLRKGAFVGPPEVAGATREFRAAFARGVGGAVEKPPKVGTLAPGANFAARVRTPGGRTLVVVVPHLKSSGCQTEYFLKVVAAWQRALREKDPAVSVVVAGDINNTVKTAARVLPLIRSLPVAATDLRESTVCKTRVLTVQHAKVNVADDAGKDLVAFFGGWELGRWHRVASKVLAPGENEPVPNPRYCADHYIVKATFTIGE